MKETNVEFNVGDIVYALKGINTITNDVAILKQRVEAVLSEVNYDGQITKISYILTDDLDKGRSTKAKAVFTTLEEAIEYAKNKYE